jgi:hypothetical protein
MDGNWTITTSTEFTVQHDGWNCGPIACLVVLYILNGPEEGERFHPKNIATGDYRPVVVAEFNCILSKSEGCLQMIKRVTVIEINETDAMEVECPICLTRLQSAELGTTSSTLACRRVFYFHFIGQWTEFIGACPICRDP